MKQTKEKIMRERKERRGKMRRKKRVSKEVTRVVTSVGMHDAMFTAGLRLPLTELHRQLAKYLGFSVN